MNIQIVINVAEADRSSDVLCPINHYSERSIFAICAASVLTMSAPNIWIISSWACGDVKLIDRLRYLSSPSSSSRKTFSNC
ncbi:Hypothetical protein FKW44_007039 [Caligus rogercresseyi]|uniref:Uncharacterized protein n=1 Tax=Caligus rogercresseyi TaxID=217165 RepID=A0A7T8QT88_CALRO|nr:Hypothetical protein FKW44_007039 [Caligus rogercresseyi]